MNDRECLQTALFVARRDSQDPNTQTGAVLWIDGVMHEAANRVPDRVPFKPYMVAPSVKRHFIEHAERAVIYKASMAVNGDEDWHSATLYAPWFACPDCARAIISVGIRDVVGLASLRSMTPDRWMADVELGERMLEDAGVSLRWVCGEVGVKIRFDGKEVQL
jgi:hypothetical protein